MSGLFGSFASASGYGQSHGGGYAKEVECNSALGVIGLLGLIELLRDIIENMVTMPEERRRRSVGDRGVFRNSLVSAMFRGGAENHHPLGSLPVLLLPLLHSAVDAADGLLPPACFEKTVCETNRVLASEGTNWGVPGAFLTNSTSSLITSVVAKVFTGDEDAYTRALQAGQAGRSGVNCEAAYSTCLNPRPDNAVVKGADVKSVVRRHLASLT
ncbi:uncharacterized protein LOC123514633 [Portunus trituberculatus]|uniref:uncharacterized protein LOC123514633 n=1 Tax=Portunus trituberculatus TaxID=210409 RepID=UPI001E1D0A2B|nr:uncharacterized protein LOC123514633 [Portunus trituberculatus]